MRYNIHDNAHVLQRTTAAHDTSHATTRPRQSKRDVPRPLVSSSHLHHRPRQLQPHHKVAEAEGKDERATPKKL